MHEIVLTLAMFISRMKNKFKYIAEFITGIKKNKSEFKRDLQLKTTSGYSFQLRCGKKGLISCTNTKEENSKGCRCQLAISLIQNNLTIGQQNNILEDGSKDTTLNLKL